MSTCQIKTTPTVDLKIRLSNGHGEKNIITNQSFKLLPDWQLLEIIHNGNSTFKIDDLLIDGQSILENIFLGWYTDQQGNYHQPRNELTTERATWSILLHNDISVLKERIGSQLPNGIYGQNLFEEYQWFVDLGFKSKKSFSPQVDNFFARPQGLNLYHKGDYCLYPYIPLDLNLTNDQSQAIESELKTLNYSVASPYHRAKANPNWSNSYLMSKDESEKKCTLTHQLPLPELKKWISSFGIIGFDHIVSYVLPAGCAIELHKDFNKIKSPDEHVYSLHVKITQNNQSKIKVAGGGIMAPGANILNAGYIHSGINESTIDRYAITIKNPKLVGLIENWASKSKIYFS